MTLSEIPSARHWVCTLLLGVLVFTVVVFSDRAVSSSGVGNKVWSVAYYEGGAYKEYDEYLYSILKAIDESGLVEFKSILSKDSTENMWKAASDATSEKLRFIDDAFYSAQWDRNAAEEIKQQLVRRVEKGSDIDLIIAMGTAAAKELVDVIDDVPVLVVSSSNPVAAGIAQGVHYSGKENVFAHQNPEYYVRQVELFHRIVGFDKLGLIYEDSEAGRSYSSLDQVNSLSKELGFEIVECHAISDTADRIQSEQEFASCFESLVDRSDAIYVTAHGGVSDNNIPDMAKLAWENKVATLSEIGGDEVKYGFLLSLHRKNKDATGRFLVENLKRILQGAKLGSLDQVFQEKLTHP